ELMGTSQGPGHAGAFSLSALDQAEPFVERAQHACEVMPALQDQPGCRDHAIGALPAGQFRRLLDAVERYFGGAPEHREHGLLTQRIDGVVAPLAAPHLAAVDIQNLGQLFAVKGDTAAPVHSLETLCLAASLDGQRQLYGLGFAQIAPPVTEPS